jgi:trigger factor
MQVSVERLGPLERRIRVEIPEDRIASVVAQRLKSLSQSTRLDGFRPGKAPLKLVEQRFGQRVREEVIGETMRTSFYEVVSRENLRPAGAPRIDPVESGQGHGLVYTATFEVYPEIELKPLGDLRIEKPVCEITDEDVDRMLEVLRKQQRRYTPVGRSAHAGDVVVIDFEGSVNGRPFTGGQARDFRAEIGARRLIPGFEEGLVGAVAGTELTLKLQLPEDFQQRDLAGRRAEFRISVKQVEEPVLPELNEEFFASYGVKEGGLDAFRAEVRRNMEREAEQTVRNRLKEAVMEALYAVNPLELPGALVETERQRLLEQLRASMRQLGASHEQLKNAGNSERLKEQARKRVSLQLLVAEIIRRENLRADPAEVRAAVGKLAASYENPEAVIGWYYADHSRLAEVEALVLEDKLVDWIAGQAQVSARRLSFDALMNKGQTGSAQAE